VCVCVCVITNPLNASLPLRSITAQEVMKGVTGKFTPINQHFVFDASEVHFVYKYIGARQAT